MKVQPVASPHAIQPTSQYSGQVARDTRAAVVAKIEAMRSEEPPRQPEGHSVNPNNISPEELSAVKSHQAEVQETPPEQAETPVVQKIEENPELKRQFARLAQQERQLRAKQRQQQEQLQTRQAEIDAKEQALKTKEQQYEQGYISKDQLKRDTLRILADSGVSYDELTQQILNQQPSDPRMESVISSLQAEIKALRGSIDEGKAQASEQQQQAYKAAVKQIETDVRATVRNDPNYEAIKATRSVSDVVELIEETYKQDGILMTVEEACDEVEKYLVEEATKLTRIGKIRRQLEQAGQPKSNEMKIQPNNKQTQMKTLTNAAASTRKLSAKERAIMAFKGELK